MQMRAPSMSPSLLSSSVSALPFLPVLLSVLLLVPVLAVSILLYPSSHHSVVVADPLFFAPSPCPYQCGENEEGCTVMVVTSR
jgi:hypothetical protein